MKTKTSILALSKAFFMLLVMCCFSSCEISNHHEQPIDASKNIQTTSFNDSRFSVVFLDSCEYILYREQFNDGHGNKYTASITHKSNCKFCEKRFFK